MVDVTMSPPNGYAEEVRINLADGSTTSVYVTGCIRAFGPIRHRVPAGCRTHAGNGQARMEDAQRLATGR